MNWIDYALGAAFVCAAAGYAIFWFSQRPKAVAPKAQANAQNSAPRAPAASHEAEHMKAAAAIRNAPKPEPKAESKPLAPLHAGTTDAPAPAPQHTYEILKQHPDGSLRPTGEIVPADQNPHAHATAKSVETGVPHVVRRV